MLLIPQGLMWDCVRAGELLEVDIDDKADLSSSVQADGCVYSLGETAGESMPTAEMATPYAPPSAEVETIATESTSVGGTHEIMPTPRPWMTTVAGPVRPRSLMLTTGS